MAETEAFVYREIDGLALELELAHPVGATTAAPCVLFFHGGAWRTGSRGQFLPQCRMLAARGTAGITVSYRLASEDSGSSPVDCAYDAEHAVQWVRANALELGIDPNRIAAGGSSAGGQLAASVAATGEPLATLVLFNPALCSKGTPRLRFMGDACPNWTVDEHFPPTLILHGTADQLVPIDDSRRFAEQMAALGLRCAVDRVRRHATRVFQFRRTRRTPRRDAERDGSLPGFAGPAVVIAQVDVR